MLSIDYIRANKQKVIDAAKNKNRTVDIDKILILDDKRVNLIQTIQKLREQRNILSRKPFSENMKEQGKQLKVEIKQNEEQCKVVEEELNHLLTFVPNVPLDEVPVGKNESENVVVKTIGKIPYFSFKPLSYLELGEKYQLFNLERGSKVSGFRGYFITNQAAILQMAILMYAFQKLTKKGYTPIIAPAIIKKFTLFGSGQIPWGEQEVYKLNDEDAYLSATAEIPITAYFSGEFIKEEDLPKKFVAFSPCFRREAGSYGKDTKGLYRVHEFWKVEQVIIANNSIEEAINLHEELQTNVEEILTDFGLPFRKLLMCTGDMGEPQIKKYDTEVWIPSRNAYGEVASNSIMGDFQTRRLKIKFRRKNGSTNFCFSLNNTALASPRILIAILENFQQQDGSIQIPKVLFPFTGINKIE
ncbi:serine--tRNA ligase [Candidatus Roizmanbacteria bacterium CG_4_10_14_0_8_um_filter_33_9]|uniref:Serine--tRNA ligase n=1 Tax=Candidatus Roizmanbacteria bacterium CG_4_10_14_0_8_um_filter_33_9 TaxID=1974826 RepID=A0A2M7QJU8_9BACT|nr:MAG: serine--tRNA ligase [Candidatus Roizmanbacteria bacterium CG_4_10_14_0_8_um_filter_33_9]